jgi:hypothetical protein
LVDLVDPHSPPRGRNFFEAAEFQTHDGIAVIYLPVIVGIRIWKDSVAHE